MIEIAPTSNKAVPVPPRIGKCPECKAPLHVYISSWITETGRPVEEDIEVTCIEYECAVQSEDTRIAMNHGHTHDRLTWEETIDKVRRWSANAIRVRPRKVIADRPAPRKGAVRKAIAKPSTPVQSLFPKGGAR